MINNNYINQGTFYLLNATKDHDTLSLTALTLLGNYKETAMKSQLFYCLPAILELIKSRPCINYLYCCNISDRHGVAAYI